MADAKRKIELVFEGVDKTSAAVQSALNNTEKFAGGINSATQPIADFADGAVKLEAGLLAAGAAITAFSIKAAGDFDTAFREISTLIDRPIEDLGEFRQAILDYASTSTAPLEEVTASIYSAISAGVDFADSIEAVSVAEKLSVAGKADLNDTLTVLVSSLNAYGLGMDEAGRFSDALFQTVRSGQTTLPELGASLASVTGLAATAGVDFEELLAAISTLTATGTPTAQAVTQIQGAISAILKPTSQASALAKQLGLDFSLQRLEAVGLEGILQDVSAATGGNAEQMARLFGRVEALNGVLTLTGLGADKFASDLEAMRNSTGAVTEAYDRMALGLGLSNQKIKNSLTGLFISIGDPLLDEYGGIAESVAAVFNAIGASVQDGNFGNLVDYMEATMAELELAVAAVARNLPEALASADLSGFTDGLDAIKGAFAELFDGIDVTSVEGLTKAIELSGKAFEGLSVFVGGVIESFGPMFDYLVDISDELAGFNPDIVAAAGNFAGVAKQANILSGAVVDLMPVLNGLVTLFAINQAGSLVSGLAAAAGGIDDLSGKLGKLGLAGAAGVAGYALGTTLNDGVESLTGTSISTWVTDQAIALGILDDEASDIIGSLNDTRAEIERPPGNIGIADALQEIEVSASRIDPKTFAGPLQEIEVSAERIEKSFRNQADAVNSIIPIYDDATGKLVGYSDGVRAGAETMSYWADSSGLAADGMSDVVEATKGLAAAGELITVEEKLALIESNTSITVASLEAGTQRIKSAFESVSETIQSTGDVLGDLTGLLGDENISKFDKLGIQDLIEQEAAARQRALDDQHRLTNATIKEINARAKALSNGQALITINGDGLEPHLEAFMWEILKAIQVRVNSDGLNMLLGTGT